MTSFHMNKKSWKNSTGFGTSSIILVFLLLIITLSACGGSDQTGEPTPEPTSSPTSSPSPTAITAATATSEPVTPTVTPTLEPYQWTVRQNETLLYIIQQLGYRSLDIIPAILTMNNMADENDLFVNQVLLVPRQTPTPGPSITPRPTDPNATPVDPNVTPSFGGCSLERRCMSTDGLYWMHEVQEGETLSYLAFAYDTTLDDLYRDNFLNETSFINPGDILKIYIRVTLTPTLTPTGGPDSTATPLPTLSAPSLLAPANGATIARDETVVLQWASTQALHTGQSYMVILSNSGSGEESRYITASNILRIPREMKPGAGQSATYAWYVVVVQGSTTSSPVISGQGSTFTFTWGD